MVKGIGYALEAMVATVILLVFSLGALEVTGPEQDWSEYQRGVAAQDLTYSLEASGHTSNFVQRGETGSIQTAMTTVSDRSMEVSGLVSDLPVTELNLGFYTLEEDRYNQDITDGPGECDGDLEELLDDSGHDDENDLYRTEDNERADDYGVTLYFANTDPTGLDEGGYDSLWVDNGTSCQFAAEDGPFFIDETFYWGDEDTGDDSDYHEFKDIDIDDENADFYNATQAWRITEEMSPGPNNLSTDVSFNMINSAHLRNQNFDVTVFRKNESIEEIEDTDDDLLENVLSDSSMLIMANFEEEDDVKDGFMGDTGFGWMGTGFEQDIDGPVDASFSNEQESLDLRSSFEGMEGSEASLEMRPPGELFSNRSTGFKPSQTVYSPQTDNSYNVTEWNREATDLEPVDPDDVDGLPDSECFEQGEEDQNLTVSEDPIDFEGVDEDKYVLSAELGLDDDACEEFEERGVKLSDDEEDFTGSEMYLNGERAMIGGRELVVESVFESTDLGNSDDCNDQGDCVNFTTPLQGSDDFAELVSVRESFQDLEGNSMAVTGYQEEFDEDQRKLLGSVIFWLGEDELGFEGREDPQDIDTASYGSIDGDTYISYELFMRWSE